MKKILMTFAIVILGTGLIYWRLFYPSTNTSNVNLPTPIPTEGIDIPSGWKTYTSDTLGYSISYPEGYQLEQNGDYSIILVKPTNLPSVGPANFIYVSKVPEEKFESTGEIYNFNNNQFRKLQGLEIGESVSLADGDQPALNEWFTYTRVDDTEVDGYPTRRYENNKPWEFPSGTTEVRFIFDARGDIYILGYYYGGDSVQEQIDPREAFKIVSTFQLR